MPVESPAAENRRRLLRRALVLRWS
jgi:hypothetical protein